VTSPPSGGAARPDIVQGELNQQRALDLRLQGLSYRAIAAEMHLAVSTVHEHVHRALDELRTITAEKAAELKQIQRARLDAMLETLWEKRADVGTANTILRLMQRQADLDGLDAPKNIRLAGEGGGPIRTDSAAVTLTESERQSRLREFGIAQLTVNGNGNGHRSN
jgi:DNA-binding CsgD family transcriptional regulator